MTEAGSFARHEVLHVVHVISGLFDEHVIRHPYVGSNPEIRAKASAIGIALGDLYQLLGSKVDVPDAPCRDVYSIAQLAERWGTSQTTVASEIKSGRLGAFRLGKLYRIRKDAIIEYELVSRNAATHSR